MYIPAITNTKSKADLFGIPELHTMHKDIWMSDISIVNDTNILFVGLNFKAPYNMDMYKVICHTISSSVCSS